MRKSDLIKGIFLSVSKSFTLNFTLAIITIIGIIFNIFNQGALKALCIFLTLEVLFIDANLFFKRCM